MCNAPREQLCVIFSVSRCYTSRSNDSAFHARYIQYSIAKKEKGIRAYASILKELSLKLHSRLMYFIGRISLQSSQNHFLRVAAR